jgi:predicted DNA-binding WGR domain protein
MPRFEFAQGASNKFWEIELSGESFTVRWGRIGTQGQSQEKTFASGAKARTEHDKLVQEKLGKGYVEVAAASALAPLAPGSATAPSVAAPARAQSPIAAPTPAPSPAPASTPGGLRVVWTDGARRKIHPRPGTGFKAARVDVAKRFDQAAGIYAGREAAKNGDVKNGEEICWPLMERVRARFTAREPVPPLQVEEEAAAGAFLGAEGQQGEGLVDYWVGIEGVAFAVDAIASSWSFESKWAFHKQRRQVSYLARRARPDAAPFYWGMFGWRILRRHLAGAEEDAYATARSVAQRHFATEYDALKSALAYLFPLEANWSREVAEGHLRSQIPAYGVMLLGALSDAELTARFAAGLREGHLRGHHPAQEYAFTLIDGIGPGALAPLRSLFALATDAAARRTLAEAIAQLEGAEVANFFRPLTNDKHVRGIANDYFIRFPHLAPNGGTSVRTAAAPPAAADSSLPSVLAAPPWLGGRKTALPSVVPNLAEVAYDEQIEWKDGDLKRKWTGPSRFADECRNEIETRIRSTGTVNFFYLDRLPPTEALETIQRHPASAWYHPDADEIVGLIAATGLAGLPAVLKLATASPLDACEVLARFDSPRVAPAMADAFTRLKKLRKMAEAWLAAHPRAAALGLIPQAVGTPGKPREAAGTVLRWMASQGHGDAIRSAASAHGAAARSAVDEVLNLDPLQLYPSKLPKLPSFWTPAAWPPPVLNAGGALPSAAIEHLGTMLAFSTLADPYAGLAQVKEACEPASLATFTWEVFQAWLRAGAPPKEQWAMLALGAMGDDETARRLTPLIRTWPGEAAGARAVGALEVLAAIGTDIALTYLYGIAQKVKFRALQDKAQEKIQQIADARGLTEEELGDFLVPDLGLEANGSRVLDFGPRAYSVSFDEELRPLVVDDAGRRLTDLPKPGAQDDPAKAGEATATWKALKKDARAIASDQVLRLERAMCSRRRWTAGTWRNVLADHPLLRHLVRRLIWGTYDDGALQATFRVAEDGTLADIHDAPFTLAAAATVGLVHPLELPAADAPAWGQRLGEYEILAPFAQIGRASHQPTAEEATAKSLRRADGKKVAVGRVLGLEKRGWRKAVPLDGGVSTEMEKFVSADRRFKASLALEPGIYLGALRETPEQHLGEITVVTVSDGQPLALGALDPVAFSELVYDLESLL